MESLHGSGTAQGGVATRAWAQISGLFNSAHRYGNLLALQIGRERHPSQSKGVPGFCSRLRVWIPLGDLRGDAI